MSLYLRTERYQDALSYGTRHIVQAAKSQDIVHQAILHHGVGQALVALEIYDHGGGQLWAASEMLKDETSAGIVRLRSQYVFDQAVYSYKLTFNTDADSLFQLSLSLAESAQMLNPKTYAKAEYDSVCGEIYSYLCRCRMIAGDRSGAENYHRKFIQSDFSWTPVGHYREMEILESFGRYKDAMKIMNELNSKYDYPGAAINKRLLSFRKTKVRIYTGMEMLTEATEAWRQYEDARLAYGKLVGHNYMNDKYEEFDTAYKMGMLKGESNSNAYGPIILALVVCILLALAITGLVFSIRYKRIIRGKNRVLADNVNLILDHKTAESREESSVDMSLPAEDAVTESDHSGVSANRREDIEYFCKQVEQRNLYSRPDFGREDLLHELRIAKTNFPRDFEIVKGISYLQYIQNLRLQSAADMIRMRSELTVEAIAHASGFSSRSTFYRQFAERFGITPTEYRRQIIKGL